MKTCPNCESKLNERFEYCRICGSKADGESLGDFTTDVTNLFEDDEGYYYIYVVGGNQQIIRAQTKEEVKSKVVKMGWPWLDPSGESVKPQKRISSKPAFKSLFLKISENHENVVSTKFTRKQDAKSTDIKIPRPTHLNQAKKAAPAKPRLVPDEELPREFGIVGIYRDFHQGREQWAYKTNENSFPIYNDRLAKLKEDIISRDYSWEIEDSDLERQAYEFDVRQKEKRDAEIMAKRGKNKLSVQEKRQIKEELAEKRRIDRNPEFANLDRMKW